MAGFEVQGEEIGAGVSVIAVDSQPGDGPALHRHQYTEVFVVLEGQATFTLRAARPGRHPPERALRHRMAVRLASGRF
jgi:quercetin dioxygenase-like cupin family protein